MGWNRGRDVKHCRWCGIRYYAAQPLDKDGFCKPAHKMAHARAYKKYVTRKSSNELQPADQRVTPKKAKKGGDRRGKKT